MGDYAGAEAEYQAALSYRYLNQDLEATKVWTRLSETHLAEADAAYRAAGEDAEAIAAVAPLYGRVVASDGTVPARGVCRGWFAAGWPAVLGGGDRARPDGAGHHC